jgi:glycosyltransferase involved in cell wall biosynthesis
MLVAQAKAAEEYFFEKQIPDSENERILAMLRQEMTNIVLIGMPGCGKSTLGDILSELTGREAIDLDRCIVEKAGRPIPEIFASEGEAAFRALERENPTRVRAVIGYDRALAARIYAACDIFLMPSASEPCGLSQMIASRYGALPVVHAVGGLFDTIKPYAQGEKGITGNGFCFTDYSAGALLESIDTALSVWQDTAQREKLVPRVMRTDFSWTRSAAVYHRLYALV